MHYTEFLTMVERVVVDAVRNCHPYAWEENHVTFSVLEKLCTTMPKVVLEGQDRPFKILWDLRKLRKPTEIDYGDVGVIVRINSWAGESIEGIGLLEAKRRDIGRNTFSAAKTRQLRHILAKAPSAKLMLYDYDNVSSCMDNIALTIGDYYFVRQHGPTLPFTHCVCIPAGIVLQIGKFTTDLHKFGIPLSYQLVARYFRGFDLEFSSDKIEAVKNNALTHGGARTLLLIGVSMGSEDPSLPSTNDDLYGPAIEASNSPYPKRG